MSPVGQVLCCALALDARERFDTASAFAAALRTIDLQAAGASIELHAAMYRRLIEAG